MPKIGKWQVDLRVGFDRNWWLRPASKASTVGAIVLAAISLILHLF